MCWYNVRCERLATRFTQNKATFSRNAKQSSFQTTEKKQHMLVAARLCCERGVRRGPQLNVLPGQSVGVSVNMRGSTTTHTDMMRPTSSIVYEGSKTGSHGQGIAG